MRTAARGACDCGRDGTCPCVLPVSVIIATTLAASSSGGITASGVCSGKSTQARRFSSQLQACPIHANRPGTICGTLFDTLISAHSSPSLSSASAAAMGIRSAASLPGAFGTASPRAERFVGPLYADRTRSLQFRVTVLLRLVVTIVYGCRKVPCHHQHYEQPSSHRHLFVIFQ